MPENNRSQGKSFQIEQTVSVEPDYPLTRIRFRLTEMMRQVQREIGACGYSVMPEKGLLPIKRMVKFDADLRASEDPPQREYVLNRIGKFLKLYRLLQAGMTECYETLAFYAADVRKQAQLAQEEREKRERKSRKGRCRGPQRLSAAEEIVGDSGFREVEKIALGGLGPGVYEHPKVKALVTQCRHMLMLKRACLVFVGNLTLGETLADRLGKNGIRVDTLMGSRAQQRRKYVQSAERFVKGEVDVLICTSAPDLGVEAVIYYTLPKTQKAKQDRDGCVSAAKELAFITNLVADRSPDCTFYCLRRQMRKKAAAEAAAQEAWQNQPPTQLGLDLAP